MRKIRKLLLASMLAIFVSGCSDTTSTLGVEGIETNFLALRGLITVNSGVTINMSGDVDKTMASKAIDIGMQASRPQVVEYVSATGDTINKETRSTEW